MLGEPLDLERCDTPMPTPSEATSFAAKEPCELWIFALDPEQLPWASRDLV